VFLIRVGIRGNLLGARRRASTIGSRGGCSRNLEVERRSRMECGLKRIYYLVTFLPEKWYRYMDYFRGILVFLLPSVWTYGLANWTHGSGWQHLAIRPPPHSPLEEKPWNRSKVEATVSESSRPGVCSRRVLEFSLTPGFVRFNEEQKFCKASFIATQLNSTQLNSTSS